MLSSDDPALADCYRRAFQELSRRALLVEEAIASLSSPRQRRLLRARYVEGLSWWEISRLLELSESSVYKLHRKALDELEASETDLPD